MAILLNLVKSSRDYLATWHEMRHRLPLLEKRRRHFKMVNDLKQIGPSPDTNVTISICHTMRICWPCSHI